MGVSELLALYPEVEVHTVYLYTYFFYGFYFAIGVKAEFMHSTVQCFFLAIIV